MRTLTRRPRARHDLTSGAHDRTSGSRHSVKHLGIAQDVPNAENRHIRLVGQPVTLSRTPSKMAARPPEFGEQTEEVLAEFGFNADEIGALRRDKVV